MVDRRFADPGAFGGADHLLGTVLFAFQIYGDFASYSAGVGEFWRRWHISLSSWMRDYVYIPLGGNRRGGWLTARNLMLTMQIAGIWHGVGWTFMLWGVLHGIALVMERVLPGCGAARRWLAAVPDGADLRLRLPRLDLSCSAPTPSATWRRSSRP